MFPTGTSSGNVFRVGAPRTQHRAGSPGAEADNLVRSLKPYKVRTALDRLDKIAVTIERLGRTMQIRINPWYHQLRRRS